MNSRKNPKNTKLPLSWIVKGALKSESCVNSESIFTILEMKPFASKGIVNLQKRKK